MNIVITGGTSGMCYEAAKLLAYQGDSLILIGSNQEKGDVARNKLKAITGNNDIRFIQADLSLVGSLKSVSEKIKEHFDKIDILVHGAGGVYPSKRAITSEGLEQVFALQYLPRFHLTNLLVDQLQAASEPKVIHIAGGGTSKKAVNLANIQGNKSYSKLSSIMRISALNDVLTAEQINRISGISFYNYGPGLVRTNTLMSNPVAKLLFSTIARAITRNAEQAGKEIVDLIRAKFPSGFYGKSLARGEIASANNTGKLGNDVWDLSVRSVQKVIVG